MSVSQRGGDGMIKRRGESSTCPVEAISLYAGMIFLKCPSVSEAGTFLVFGKVAAFSTAFSEKHRSA
jgi:hypothetical protein